MNRRDLLQLTVLGAASAAAPARAALPRAVSPFAHAGKSVRALQEAMAKGKLTSVALTTGYLARIQALNLEGPQLRAILEVNPEALQRAAALDAERKAGKTRGPLHGIPVVLKDNLDTFDRMQTTAGSLALLGSPAPRDAFVVQRLREAGAVLLAKSNLSEWANLRSTRALSGWSARGGQGKNPYALDRSPIGSSSGSATAVAADLCALAVGTETDGSITAPASAHALVGLKPTVGLLSRTGIIPLSATQDTPGPMARTVEDAALLLGAMVGLDASDPASRAMPMDFLQGLQPNALEGARLGVVRGLFGKVPAVTQLAERAFADLKRLGAVLVDPVELPLTQISAGELDVLLYELKAGLAAYLADRRPDAKVKSLADVIAFNRQNAAAELPWFGQELFEQAQEKGPLTSKAYLEALEACRTFSRDQGIDAALRAQRLDALIAPTLDPAWVIDPFYGDPSSAAAGTTPAAVAGYPSLTVPMGDVFGLPVGLLFFAGAWSEPRLLALGFAYEQGTLHRRPPGFAASLTPR